jgi:hypothetical protein
MTKTEKIEALAAGDDLAQRVFARIVIETFPIIDNVVGEEWSRASDDYTNIAIAEAIVEAVVRAGCAASGATIRKMARISSAPPEALSNCLRAAGDAMAASMNAAADAAAGRDDEAIH